MKLSDQEMREKMATSLEYLAKRVREDSGHVTDWISSLQNIIYWLGKLGVDRAEFEIRHQLQLIAMGVRKN